MATSTFFERRRNMTWGSDPLIKNLLLSTDIPAAMDTGRDPEPVSLLRSDVVSHPIANVQHSSRMKIPYPNPLSIKPELIPFFLKK
jgi:hypothetical protein